MALQQLLRQQQQQEAGLVSFRAGRLHMNSNKLITAEDKPGKIKLMRSDEGYLHFQWMNRIDNQVELDIMLFPNTASWHKVEECKDGRVFVLKFVESRRREFFWMQEPSIDKDNEYFEKINKLCKGQTLDNSNNNNFDALNQQMMSGMQGPSGNNMNANNNAAFQNFLMGMGMNGYDGGSHANANANANTNPNRNNANLSQLLLNAMNNNNTGNQTQNNTATTNNNNNTQNAFLQAMQQAANQQREQLAQEPDLTDILDPTENGEIEALLDDEKVIEELGQHLPENMRSTEDIMEQLQSPQFLSSLRRLQGAVNGPQMTLILQQMGLPPTQQMGVRAFLHAISQRNANASNASNNNASNTNNTNTKK